MTSDWSHLQPALPDFRGYRYPHLGRLWQRLCEEPELPQLDRWLSQQLRAQKQFGRQDRLFYADALFTTMRFLLPITLLEEGYQRQVSDMADFALARDAELAGTDIWQAARHLPPATVWFWLQQLLPGSADAPRELEDDLPFRQPFWDRARDQWQANEQTRGLLHGWRTGWHTWLRRRAEASDWSEDIVNQFLLGQNTRPPLWVRVQKPKQAGAVVRELEQLGFTVSADEDALQATGGRSIYQSAAYRLGGLEIQDWASQQISRAVGARPGEVVWDACAGGGGKTQALASRMNNRGTLIATDIRAYKLEELQRRAQRAGWFNIQTRPWDASGPLELPSEAAGQGGFDRVLVDAPCTGAGTWRRNPDARWRLSEQGIAEQTELQTRIMNQVAPSVRPGGTLVYATCSWLTAENEEQVFQWLQGQPDFTLVSQQLVGFPEQDADTMYFAILRRSEH
ncbi:MAG: RsmB/NOP family class I SAM-dependent RNA methyltransferase [Natronospirillum sp.]|uniref:RsmB/NOP family class I SAM-dependent RNA methyltransferase n=1 Tax=Natronospirillum sp. TaxID=2812955 RepID=UPI0025E4321E|nr:RsmB/NOP family class I SAM-dependent RNA methyltransferase [Natronospirillum sp.]MCH8551082.1 RsmB/NOP family class I SAM-dependent RNA methyltransferase [Natronospirillum sp.]